MVRTPRTSRALLSLAIAAASAVSARADDWVVRPVRLGTGYPSSTVNVDVLPTDAGVTLGYTLPGDLDLYLSTLPSGQPFFQHQCSSSAAVYDATFAADTAGNIYFAGAAPGSGIRVGADAAGWGLGIVSGLHPTTSLGARTTLPAVAVDSHGIPAFVATDVNGQTVLSHFDPPSGTWQNQTLPAPTASGPLFQRALAYTPDNRAVVACFTTSYPNSLFVAVQTDSYNWAPLPSLGALAGPTYGVSVATAPDGRIGVAYSVGSSVSVATYDGLFWSINQLSSLPATLETHSLTVDADGDFALAYVPRNSTTAPAPLHLARQSADGSWADQTLPLSAKWGAVAFDSANHPYVGAFDGTNVLLAGTTIHALLANDFTLDGTVTSADVPAFAQAVRHPSTYLAAHSPPLSTTADLVSIGDHNGDVRLTDADARAFVESLNSAPVPGLANRTAGFLAFDQADLDPSVGSGTGNFFATTLSTGKAYAAGDSRADLTGPTPDTGDGHVDAFDINYLHDAILAATPSTPANIRLDLNGDGRVDADDLHTLVYDILGTAAGDANGDDRVTADDYALVDRGSAKGLTSWSDGDFNLDGVVNSDDYARLDLAFAQSNGGSLSPALLAQRESQFGDAYVQSLLASIPEPSCTALLLCLTPLVRRRRRH